MGWNTEVGQTELWIVNRIVVCKYFPYHVHKFTSLDVYKGIFISGQIRRAICK